MTGPLNPRRLALGAARKFIFEGNDPETILERISGIDRHGNILKQSSPTPEDLMSRPRDRILQNLDEMYSEAFQRAKESGDQSQRLARIGLRGCRARGNAGDDCGHDRFVQKLFGWGRAQFCSLWDLLQIGKSYHSARSDNRPVGYRHVSSNERPLSTR